MGFWSGVKDMAKGLSVITLVVVGTVGAYLKNEDNQAAKRDKVSAVSAEQKRFLKNKGMNVDPYTKDGAVQGIHRLAEDFIWTPSQADNNVLGTKVEIETASGEMVVASSHPKISKQNTTEKTYNVDTLLDPAGATNVVIPRTANIGNTLLPGQVERINDSKGIRIGVAPKKEGVPKQGSVAKTLSHNGNQVVCRGKAPQKTVQGVVQQTVKTGRAQQSKGADVKYTDEVVRPAVFNSRRGKGYAQDGQALSTPSKSSSR